MPNDTMTVTVNIGDWPEIQDLIAKFARRCRRAEEDVDRLAPYAWHKEECYWMEGGAVCNCGFDDAIAAHRTELARRDDYGEEQDGS